MNRKNLELKKQAYVMSCIYCTGYSDETGEFELTGLTDKQKLQYVYDNFKSEAFNDYNMRKFKNNKTDIIADHLMGLPSYLNIEFRNFNILEIGKKWGYDLSAEKKEQNFINNWFKVCAFKFVQLCEKYEVSL